jgi:hypothetical protein
MSIFFAEFGIIHFPLCPKMDQNCRIQHYRVFTVMSMAQSLIIIVYVFKPVSPVDLYPPILPEPLLETNKKQGFTVENNKIIFRQENRTFL